MIRFKLTPLGDPVFVSLAVSGPSELAELIYEGEALGVDLAREHLAAQLGAGGVIIGARASARDVYLALFGPDADPSFGAAIDRGAELLG